MKSSTLAAFVIGLAAAAAASAQQVTVKGSIPFGFSVNGKSMPAGHYVIFHPTVNGPVYLREPDQGKTAMVVTSPVEERRTAAATPRLIFHGYEGHYFLYQVWIGGGAGVQLAPSQVERELAARLHKLPDSTVVSAIR